MDPFLGEIQIFGFNYAPRGWAMCQGQLMSIAQNTALFSLLGTTYGGDGRVTFALPNLQGRIANGAGLGPGLGQYVLGQVGGAATVTLTAAQLPAHTHALPVSTANNTKQSTPGPANYLGLTGSRGETQNVYASPAQQASSPAAMLSTAVSPAGSGQPHNNLAPYLTLNFCIALQGIFPQRP